MGRRKKLIAQSKNWSDASDSNALTCLVKACPIPAGGALNVLAGKIILEAGDAIVVSASSNNSLDVSGSVVEMG